MIGTWTIYHYRIMIPEKNVFCIFQPGEEAGEGAKICCDIFEKEKISEIYGIHNIPGFNKGEVLLREGNFACASVGLEIRFFGKTAHAAYPEKGINPASAMAETITGIEFAPLLEVQNNSSPYRNAQKRQSHKKL